jgi:hypothetical protein
MQAMDIVRLKDRLAESEEVKREARSKLAAAHADVHRLQDLVNRMEQDVDQARV